MGLFSGDFASLFLWLIQIENIYFTKIPFFIKIMNGEGIFCKTFTEIILKKEGYNRTVIYKKIFIKNIFREKRLSLRIRPQKELDHKKNKIANKIL